MKSGVDDQCNSYVTKHNTAAVEWCYGAGVVTGYTDPVTGEPTWEFGPEAPVTREQLAAMVARYAAYCGVDTSDFDGGALSAMPDGAQHSPYAGEALAWCASAGLVTGWVDASGAPWLLAYDTATRAQMAKIATVLVRDVLGEGISRGEWASRLISELGIEASPDVEGCPFDDLDGSPYADAVRTAWRVGAFAGIVGSKFSPSSSATVEFAAASAALACGFSDDGSEPACGDAGKADPRMAGPLAVAIDVGLLELDGGLASPKMPLEEGRAKGILDAVRKTAQGPDLSAAGEAQVSLADGVKRVEDADASVSDDGSSATVSSAAAEGLRAGDVVVVGSPDGGIGAAISVSSVAQGADGTATISGEAVDDPSLIADEIYAAGTSGVQDAEFVPEEGVEVESASVYGARALGSNASFGTLSLKAKWEPKDNVKIEVAAKPKPSIEYLIDYSWGNLREAYLVLDVETEASFSVAAENALDSDFSKKLGEVPVPIAGGALTANLEVYAVFSVEGGFSIAATVDQRSGFHYCKGHVRTISDFDVRGAELDLEAEAKAGVELCGSLKIGPTYIADASVEGGLEGEGGATLRPDGGTCFDLTGCLYADIEAGKRSKPMQLVNASWKAKLVDRDNSPWKWSYHEEDGVEVPECTYGTGTVRMLVLDPPTYAWRTDADVRVYEKTAAGRAPAAPAAGARGSFAAKLYKGDYIAVARWNGLVAVREFSVSKGDGRTLNLILGYGEDPGSVAIPEEEFEYKVGYFIADNRVYPEPLDTYINEHEWSVVRESYGNAFRFSYPGVSGGYPNFDCGFGVYITDYKGGSTDVVIPKSINGVDVVCVDLSFHEDASYHIDVSECTELKSFSFTTQSGEVISVDFGNNRLVKDAWFQGEFPCNVDMGSLSGLETLNFYACNMGGFSLDGGNLKRFNAMMTNIERLDLSGCSNLKELWCIMGNLAFLDVSGCEELRMLDCSNNQLTYLDISSLKNLQELYCAYNNIRDTSALESWLAADGHYGQVAPQNA